MCSQVKAEEDLRTLADVLEQWVCKREHQACDDAPGDEGDAAGGAFRRTILQHDKEIDPNWMLVWLWSRLYGLFQLDSF